MNERGSHTDLLPTNLRERIISAGYLVYPTTGITLGEVINKTDFPPTDDSLPDLLREHPRLTHLKTKHPWIAIRPRDVLSQEFRDKTFPEQKFQIIRLGQNIQALLGNEGIRVLIGTAADYADIAYAHYEATGGDILYDPDYYIRSSTLVEGQNLCIGTPLVAGHRGGYRLDEDYETFELSATLEYPELRNPAIAHLPIIVPKVG